LLDVRIVSTVFIPLREPPPSKAGQGIGELFAVVGVGVGVCVLAVAVGVSVLVSDFAIGAGLPSPDEQAVRRRIKNREVSFILSCHRYFIN